jgi:regulator of replication initiation timing
MAVRFSIFVKAVVFVLSLSGMPVLADQKDEEIAKLKTQVEVLIKENQQLRKMLAQQPLQAGSNSVAVTREAAPEKEKTTAPTVTEDKQAQGYWITTSSSKRHNSNCRYYKNSKGRACTKDEGVACKICGG